MSNKLFIGNLAWGTNDSSLSELFSQAGTVVSAKVITDRETGRSKGYGFVEYASEAETAKAIELFNGKDLDGRAIKVNVAKPREDKPFRSSSGPRKSFQSR